MEKEQSYLWKYLKAIKNKFYLPLEESQNDEFPFFPLVFFFICFLCCFKIQILQKHSLNSFFPSKGDEIKEANLPLKLK